MSEPGRILTTHTGSLPRPDDLAGMMLAFDRGELKDVQRLRERVAEATAEVVRKQAETGLDIVSDGEYGKTSYTAYVKERLTGFEGETLRQFRNDRERQEFPDFTRESSSHVKMPSNNGPVSLKDPEAVRRDVANLKAALAGVQVQDAFMTAAPPGQIARFMPSTYYKDEEEYLYALADAMRDEYETIVGAGFILQLDCPDLASGRSALSHLTIEQFRDVDRLHVKALNYAVRDLPRDRLRLHICWGNYQGPHNDDVPIQDILDVVLEANVGAFLFEAANPRHAHEWKVFEKIKLPAGKKIVPGVLDSCTNYIEHPELVQERLVRYAELVGRENVLAGVDCGFGTSVGLNRVAPTIAWAKLRSMVEGAQLASQELWA